MSRASIELEQRRGSGPSPHAHPWTESYVITEGTVEVTMGDRTFTARPGYFFEIPPERLTVIASCRSARSS